MREWVVCLMACGVVDGVAVPAGEMNSSGPVRHCGPWVRDGFASIQLNVDRYGCNIVGDAANETTIAADPTEHRNLVIGWRQFNDVTDSLREAGYAYSHDGGRTWVYPGVLAPGAFRSDPVMAAGPAGEFYYFGTAFDSPYTFFRSYDGGVTWNDSTLVDFIDKPWMAVDLTDGIGRGNIYIWRSPSRLWRSVDSGASFQRFFTNRGTSTPSTIAVGVNGEVYLIGPGAGITMSVDASDPQSEPVFEILGGPHAFGPTGDFGAPPNPGGLFGQPWIAIDHSDGPTRGNLYVLASVRLDDGTLDVRFARSSDGGATWDETVRVNDDAVDSGAYQWFGMMSLSPDGRRIDAVWNDTRNSGQDNLSELYYSFSTDAGDTWSPNIPVSPMFDSWIGFPSGSPKLGDYYHMVSDNLGVNVAYAATFNGEQDVYFLRIGPWDCNGNDLDDARDIAEGVSLDCNGNDVPDECEYRADLDGDGLTTLTDHTAFVSEITGPDAPFDEQCAALLDIDHDADIDLADFYGLQRVFVGR